MFHPDKHSTDPNKQKWAEQIFNKVKEAYEVLSDSHKRAIYDTLGKLCIMSLTINEALENDLIKMGMNSQEVI